MSDKINHTFAMKKLITDNFIVKFPSIIKDVIYYDGVFIVLLDDDVNDNVFGVNIEGKIIWQIQNPSDVFITNDNEKQDNNYLYSSNYVAVFLTPENNFAVNNFSAMRFFFNYKTGRITGKEWMRW